MVSAGEEVRLSFVRTREAGAVSDVAAEVLWHDRLLLAAQKPAGLLVHGDGTGADTLTARVQHSLAGLAARDGWPQPPVAQALQRLDVCTTGIVLFSLTEEFQPTFDAMVAAHRMRKRYLAVVRGTFPMGAHVIDRPIARDRHDARRMRVGKTGKPAQTKAMCVRRGRGCSLVACELVTGRRHQIRVHLSSMGYPILGDALYGQRHGREGQLMLHAYEEAFVHPVLRERVVLRTEWPERFADLFPPTEVDWSILNSL